MRMELTQLDMTLSWNTRWSGVCRFSFYYHYEFRIHTVQYTNRQKDRRKDRQRMNTN